MASLRSQQRGACPCPQPAGCFPHYVAYKVRRRTLEIAGGPDAINELFAARLGGFFRESGEAFEVGYLPITVFAREKGGGTVIALTARLNEWRDHEPLVTYDFHAWDLAQRYFPSASDYAPPIDGPFWPRFRALSGLIAEWPEIVSVRCSRSDSA